VSLEVYGDVVFGNLVVVRDMVVIANRTDSQVTIRDGRVIQKDLIFR
jgi:hypothetical protein